ncbi:MAG: TonB-dependent receptor [Pseudomonadales bacterium]
MNPLNRVSLSLCAALLLTAGAQAAAQTASQTDGAMTIEEVVVTARRTAENLQSVPASISAFSGSALEEARIEDVGELQGMVPNLSLHVGDASNAVIYIRGVGQIDALAFSDPGVGVYVDDVYLGRAQGSFLDVMEVDRIEVLRGPQGTLYGRNTIGGAVKYVSAKPGDTLEAKVDVSVGDYNKQDIKASVGGPLTDILKAKLSIAQLTRDGYTENRYDRRGDGDRDTFAWRGLLLLEPTDSLSFQLTIDGSDANPSRSRTPAKETSCCTLTTAPMVPADVDPFSLDVSFNTVERTQSDGVSLSAEYAFSDSTALKYIVAKRELEYNGELDLDGTRHRTFDTFFNLEQEQTSHELQLTIETDGLTTVLGYYRFDEESTSFDGIIGPSLPFLPAFGLDVFVFSGLNLNISEGDALYGNVTYGFSEQLSASFGARYSQEEKLFERIVEFFPSSILPADPEAITQQTLAIGGGTRTTNLNVPKTNDLDNDWNNLSLKASLNYQHTDDVMYYVSVAEGFKSGGFNGRSNNEFEADPYDEENLLAYEVGFKSRFADDRVQLNGAFFHNDYEDFQVQIFTVNPDTGAFVGVFRNAGMATTYGLELELQSLLGENFSISGGLGYLKSEYDEFIDTDVDVADSRKLVNAPEWDISVGLEWHWPISGGSFTLATDLNYRSKTYLSVSSSEVLAQGSYTLVNANMRWATDDDKWLFILSGKNLTDEIYRNHGFDLAAIPGVELGYYGAPRTYALSGIYQF